MTRSLWALQGADPGFRPQNVLTMTVPIPKSSEKAQRSRFYDEFLPRVAALPGVRSVAAIDNLPMQGGSEQPIAVEGRPVEVFALQRNVSVRQATPGYFRTMGIPMLSGRDFNLADTSGEKAVAVISRSMANLFWPGENPMGKRFRISFTPETVREVVGVVDDIKDRGLQILEPVTMLYIPILQSDTNAVSLVVRGDGDVTRLTPRHYEGSWGNRPRTPHSQYSNDGRNRGDDAFAAAVQHVAVRRARRAGLSARVGRYLQRPGVQCPQPGDRDQHTDGAWGESRRRLTTGDRRRNEA